MEWYRTFAGVVIVSCFVLLIGKQLGRSELIFFGGDESRHFMNGVFLHDLLADGGWRAPLDYLRWYYLKYPALSVHQYPPLIYALEALVISVAGIHVQAVQVMLAALIGGGLWCWYSYVARKFTVELAFLSSMLLLTRPIFLNNVARVMLDSAALALVLMLLAAAERWQTTHTRRAGIVVAALTLMLMGIELKAYFMVWYLLLLALSAPYLNASAKKYAFAILAGFSVMFACFFFVGTVAQATKIRLLYRMLQGVNMMSVYKLQHIWLTGDVGRLLPFRWVTAFGLPLLGLTLCGLLAALYRGHWPRVRADVLYAANFIFMFMFCITHFEPERFNLFLVPTVALFSGYGLDAIFQSVFRRQTFRRIAIAVTCVICLGLGWRHETIYLRGYEQAARDLLARNSTHAPILCDAYLDGNFIAYLRKHDSARQALVFRGDKMLYSAEIYYRYIKKTYIAAAADVYARLDDFNIRYIVVDQLYCEIPAKMLLRRVLQNPAKFRLCGTYPAVTNIPDFQGNADLEVYEYLAYKTNYTTPLQISVPVMGATLAFTIADLQHPPCSK